MGARGPESGRGSGPLPGAVARGRVPGPGPRDPARIPERCRGWGLRARCEAQGRGLRAPGSRDAPFGVDPPFSPRGGLCGPDNRQGDF